MINWFFKKALNLISMQIHSNYSSCTSSDKQICNQFSSYRNSWFVFSVLSCPPKVRKNSSNVSSGA